MTFSHIFFDLDGTLYPGDNGLWEQISTRMNAYMHEKLEIPLSQVSETRQQYFLEYGTTLRGLQHHHQIDSEEYLAYVHNVPLEEYLSPAPHLREILQKLPQEKWILTNSDRNHANRVLKALNIHDFFNGIVDVWATDYHPKPEPIVFRIALELAGNPPPESCVFIDDIPKNLIPAGQIGFTTILIGKHKPSESIDHHIMNLHELLTALPELKAKRMST